MQPVLTLASSYLALDFNKQDENRNKFYTES